VSTGTGASAHVARPFLPASGEALEIVAGSRLVALMALDKPRP
jgi:hypothetical protein